MKSDWVSVYCGALCWSAERLRKIGKARLSLGMET